MNNQDLSSSHEKTHEWQNDWLHQSFNGWAE